MNIVQIRGLIVNTSVTSREAILKACRKLISEKGISSLNMRAVAKDCDVALGALYYYFPSKNDLLIAAIESVWEDIFRFQDIQCQEISFLAYMEKTFYHVQKGIQKYPNFFTIHSISFSAKNRGEAYDKMRQYLEKLKERMLVFIRMDHSIHKDVFSTNFSEEDFVDFVLANLICLLVQKKKSCQLLLEVMKRTLY